MKREFSGQYQEQFQNYQNFDQPILREELKTTLELSSTDFINGLESLQQRYLITKIKGDQIKFKLSLVFREYIKNKKSL